MGKYSSACSARQRGLGFKEPPASRLHHELNFRALIDGSSAINLVLPM